MTTHDALGAYAKRYGLEVIATVIPSRSTRGQASAGETAELVRTIKREHVPAVFAESSVNADVEEAIAREAGAQVSPPLWADSLGPKGSSGATYIGSMQANTRTIVVVARRGCRPVHVIAAFEAFSAPYMQRALVEILLLAVLAGALGAWIVLRRLAFFTHSVGTAAFPGLVVAGPWGIAPQLAALGAALGFAGARERLARDGDEDAATGILLVGALALGALLASDVYRSGAGVDRLLFGTLIGLSDQDLLADRARRRGGAGRRRRRCAARGSRAPSTPTACARSASRSRGRSGSCSPPWRPR